MRNLIIAIQASLLLVGCGGESSGSSQTPVALCNSSTGLRAPLPACSSNAPCTRLAAELGVAPPPITTPTITPTCDAGAWDERFTQTVLGFTRHACIHRPPGASSLSKRSLVVWFHPGGNSPADLAETETGLIAKADSFDLTGDMARPGFILASVQGRNLHFPTAAPRDGQHHDFYYRDLDSLSTNPDIANADALIDKIVQEGIVDTDRIYVMGWSNGAFFSQLYAIARHTTATAGGNRVAAASVFTAANPFGDVSWNPFDDTAHDDGSSCEITPPVSTVPINIVYRTSDAAVACDAIQAACFSTEPGYTTDEWISQATSAGLSVSGLRIGGIESGRPVSQDAIASNCTDYSGGCPPTDDCATDPAGDYCLSIVNHARWPDGIYNSFSSMVDREVDMLQFLKNNPNL